MKLKRAGWWTILVALAALPAGCGALGGDLDQAQHEVHVQFYQATDKFLEAVDAFADIANTYADKKHAIQARWEDTAWALYVESNTDPATGKISLSPERFAQATRDRQDELDIRQTSRDDWSNTLTQMRATMQRMKATVDTIRTRDVEWQEAKASVAAAMQDIVKLMAAMAGGIGIGAAAI